MPVLERVSFMVPVRFLGIRRIVVQQQQLSACHHDQASGEATGYGASGRWCLVGGSDKLSSCASRASFALLVVAFCTSL